MASLNKVILIGHLTADPELKQTQSGTNVTSFTIGVTRKFSKEGQPSSDFINIVAWRQTAEFVCKFFKKVNPICICGSIQTRSYDAQDGTKRYVTEVLADEVSFVEKRGSGETAAPAPANTAKEEAVPQFEELAPDGDLPF